MKKLITLLLLLLSVSSYSQQNINEETISAYYDTIVHYVEDSDLRYPALRYEKDVKIYLKGDNINYLREELINVIDELNELVETINISLTEDSTDYNLLVFLGSKKDMCEINSDFIDNKCLGWGIIYGGYKNSIILSECFVDIKKVKDPIRRKHILREEVTQCLGFSNDTNQYQNSIFYEGYSTINKFSKLDKEIIRLLYKS